ncbi:Fanconi anemia group E protein-like [Glandiceps talaboti]
MEWTVSTSHVFQTLLDLKVELDNETLNKFLNLLEHHGVACQKCLKFGKVLVTAVNKYGKQFSQGHISTMSRILDVNKTYLKKTATTALKKL